MDNQGLPRFYYAQRLPARAVAVAKVSSTPSRPSDLTDINNTPFGQGPLTITPVPSGDVVDASVLGNTAVITGSSEYLLANQFFELTNEVDGEGNPFYYRHQLPSSSVQQVSVVDAAGKAVTKGWRLGAGEVLHDLDGSTYFVSYYESQVQKTKLLQYLPVMERRQEPGPRAYIFNPGGLVTVLNASLSYRIRFVANNGFFLLPPYSVPPADPWYPRVRFNLRPVLPEWGRQAFLPRRPYRQASWAPAKVLSKNLVEFERCPIWFDPIVGQYPDVLVYDKDYQLRFALDGVPVKLSRTVDKGYLFPWITSKIVDIDPMHGRLQLNVDLNPDDIVFGFYSYAELDVVFTALDVNPFSNPAVKDKVIEFYWADRSNDIPPRT